MASTTAEMATMAEPKERTQKLGRGIRKAEHLLVAERAVWRALDGLLP
jgi:hypothetical protein